MALEIKCPFPASPGEYKAAVYYKVPKYYVPQLLAEMHALSAPTLLFVCYSKSTTCCMKAYFDEELWSLMMTELALAFQTSTHPTRKSETIAVLKEKIEAYTNEKVTFIAEVPSVCARECKGSVSTIDRPYCEHEGTYREQSVTSVVEVSLALRGCRKTIKTAYQLSRVKANEFLGFMISDLDRLANVEGVTAIPIAYGLKGYSLPTDALRAMLEYVLQKCAEVGLYVPVVSFDGQWFRITVRDDHDCPLTLLQLQKDVFAAMKKRTVPQLLADITNRNVVRVRSLDELRAVVRVESSTTDKPVLCRKIDDDSIQLSKKTHNSIVLWKKGKLQKNKSSESENQSSQAAEVLSSLPQDLVENIPENVVQEVLTDESARSEPNHSSPQIDDIGVAVLISEQVVSNPSESTSVGAEPSQTDGTSVLSETDLKSMLNALRDNSKRPNKDWDGTTLCDFKQMFANAETIDKSMTKAELVILLKPVMAKLKSQDIAMNSSMPKNQIVTKLSEILGDSSALKKPQRRFKRSPSSLASLSKASLSKLPKDILCSICASREFQLRCSEWYDKNPFGKKIAIDGLLCETDNWYSMPEFNNSTGNYLLMVLDSYHQLCGLRRLVCQNGIPMKGINREAFVSVAKDAERNKCQLNLAMVNDLIDKQNVEFAKATFSSKVSSALDEIGEHEAAKFCRLVNNWYMAEDEPGISSLDRCRYRLELKRWLLDGVSIGEFHPAGSHIQGIPVVLFEGLITNIERKMQLYTLTKLGTYNVRAVGSLDIENFFGTFQDLDPRGTGVT